MASNPEAQAIVDSWRLRVGRLPRALENHLYYFVGKHGVSRVARVCEVVAESGHRRTSQRVALLGAYLGESLPAFGEDA